MFCFVQRLVLPDVMSGLFSRDTAREILAAWTMERSSGEGRIINV